MFDAAAVARVLGGEAVLKTHVRSMYDLERLIAQGLPKQALRAMVEHLTSDRQVAARLMAEVVPPATYKRRRSNFTLAESERIERLARVAAAAEEVWEDQEEAREFLGAKHPMLDNRTPLDVARTELGARRVEYLLASIVYGLPV